MSPAEEQANEATAIAAEPAPAPAIRTLITGSPRAGKTTRSEQLGAERGLTPRHTDETMRMFDHLPPSERWSAQSVEVATWFDAAGPWVIEGVVVPRALRKWLAAHPEGRPCDVVELYRSPVQELTKGQETMRKGIETVWAEVASALEARGVVVEAR